MKRYPILVGFLFISVVCFSQNQSPLVGTWKLVSGKMTRNDSTQNYDPSRLNSLKIVTPTHFAVFGQNPDGTFSHAAAGTIQITPTNYTEKLSHGNMLSWIGKEVKFTYTVKSDTWQVKGGVDSTTFEETWTRVK